MREILKRLWNTYPPEKRAADYRVALVCGAVYRPLSFFVSAVLIRVGVSANAVTYARYIAIAGECASFAAGTHAGMVAGAVCHACHFFLDYVDGNIARYHARTTRFGALLDGMADRLGYILPPLMIGVGLYRRPDALILNLPVPVPPWLPLALGAAASLGTALLLTWDPRRWREFLALLQGRGAPRCRGGWRENDPRRPGRGSFGRWSRRSPTWRTSSRRSSWCWRFAT